MTADSDTNLLAMDEDTAKLILQIQMEDMEQFKKSSKGKGRATDVATDAEMAMDLYKKDLEDKAVFISDRLMSKSIQNAVRTDGRILSGALESEDRTARAHVAAVSGQTPDMPKEVDESVFGELEAQIINDEVLEKLAAKYGSGGEGYSGPSQSPTETQKECMAGGESSSWAASRPRKSSTKQDTSAIMDRPCVSCGDTHKFFDLARVPCGHEYCQPCLQELFRLAMSDESLFPPRCCRQQITLGSVRMWLGAELAVGFYRKKVELDTPNRTYCSNTACTKFIHTQNIANDIASCEDCGFQTCAMCKGPAHRGDCPKDTALQQVLQVAEANRWQRCYSCSGVVELSVGCNHIT